MSVEEILGSKQDSDWDHSFDDRSAFAELNGCKRQVTFLDKDDEIVFAVYQQAISGCFLQYQMITHKSLHSLPQHDGAPEVRMWRITGVYSFSNVPNSAKAENTQSVGVPSELTDAEAYLWNRLAPQIPEGWQVTLCADMECGAPDTSTPEWLRDVGYDTASTDVRGDGQSAAHYHWQKFRESELKTFYLECKALDELGDHHLGAALRTTIAILIERGYSFKELTKAIIEHVQDDPIVRTIINTVRGLLPTHNGAGGVCGLSDDPMLSNPGISVREAVDAMIDAKIQSVASDLQELFQSVSVEGGNNGLHDFLDK